MSQHAQRLSAWNWSNLLFNGEWHQSVVGNLEDLAYIRKKMLYLVIFWYKLRNEIFTSTSLFCHIFRIYTFLDLKWRFKCVKLSLYFKYFLRKCSVLHCWILYGLKSEIIRCHICIVFGLNNIRRATKNISETHTLKFENFYTFLFTFELKIRVSRGKLTQWKFNHKMIWISRIDLKSFSKTV